MRIKRSSALLLTGSLVAGLMLGASTTAASAGTASSSTAYFSAGANDYKDWAQIGTSPGRAAGNAAIARSDGTMQPGWGGVNARVFRASNNAMVGETGFQYNVSSAGANTYFPAFTPQYLVTGTFYSWGVVRGWSGSAYSNYYTFKTPNQTS